MQQLGSVPVREATRQKLAGEMVGERKGLFDSVFADVGDGESSRMEIDSHAGDRGDSRAGDSRAGESVDPDLRVEECRDGNAGR